MNNKCIENKSNQLGKNWSKSDGERFIVIENKLILVDQNILPLRDNLIFICPCVCVIENKYVYEWVRESGRYVVCAYVCGCV